MFWPTKAPHKLCCLLPLLVLISCRNDKTGPKETPAKVANPVTETALTTITLSAKAEERLGIETAVVEARELPGVLKAGGEIIAVPGREANVTAPVSGTVLYAQTGPPITAGLRVKKGQEIMRLLLMPPEKELSTAQAEVAVKQAEYEVALAKYRRLEELFEDKAVSEKSLQQAQAELTSARATLSTAKGRLELLNSSSLDSVQQNLSTFVLESPIGGVLQHVFVAPGQTVPVSAPLFVVCAQTPVWIRVPVYVGDLKKIDIDKEAETTAMGGILPDERIFARPVQGPPLSDALSASSDLFYELANSDGRLRIGHKVMVFLPLTSSESSYTVPFS
jgi:cobalt-zinc-cadmium efflux system membrane fusion protein